MANTLGFLIQQIIVTCLKKERSMVNMKSAIYVVLFFGLVGCSGDPVKTKIEDAMVKKLNDHNLALRKVAEEAYDHAVETANNFAELYGEDSETAQSMYEMAELSKPDEDMVTTDIWVSVTNYDCDNTSDTASKIICDVEYERGATILGNPQSFSDNSKITFSQVDGVWTQESKL